MRIGVILGLILFVLLYLLVGIFIDVIMDRFMNIEIGFMLWLFWPTIIIIAPLVLLCGTIMVIGETIRDKIDDLFDYIVDAFRK